MSETNWSAIFDQLCALPEHQQARVRWAGTILQVERRGQVLVALREISVSARRSMGWRQGSGNLEDARDFQLLYVANRHFLCSWRRQPTEWSWLQTLAAVQL